MRLRRNCISRTSTRSPQRRRTTSRSGLHRLTFRLQSLKSNASLALASPKSIWTTATTHLTHTLGCLLVLRLWLLLSLPRVRHVVSFPISRLSARRMDLRARARSLMLQSSRRDLAEACLAWPARAPRANGCVPLVALVVVWTMTVVMRRRTRRAPSSGHSPRTQLVLTRCVGCTA